MPPTFQPADTPRLRLLPRPSTTGQVSTLVVTAAMPSSFRPGSGLAVRPFLHDILERRRVPHYTFEVLRARERYFCFLASPDMTLRCNLSLRPAMRLRRRRLAANYAAGVFIRASQGVSTKKTTYRLGILETIRFRLYNRCLSRRQVRRCTKGKNDAVGCHVCGLDRHRRAEKFRSHRIRCATIRFVDLPVCWRRRRQGN